MPARYTPLRDSHAASDDEMEAAFESDDEEHSAPQATGLVIPTSPSPSAPVPGAYNFERVHDYDYPPPGSPPRPSALALPNEIGNSNGQLPSGTVARPDLTSRSVGLLRRGVAALFPSRYSRLPTSADQRSRPMGAGLDNDGVFANVTAKPVRGSARLERGDDGIYVVPEEVQKEAPPSYATAQADAVPPYWETTVHAPSASSAGEMIVDGLATGTLFSFLWNMLISFSFTFVGFLLTYLLHTTHAAKFGSRAGLGVTLLQYGFQLRNNRSSQSEEPSGGWSWNDAAASPAPSEGFPNATLSIPEYVGNGNTPSYTQDWVAFIFMTFGWFLLLTSILGYWRVKRWEKQILTSAPQPPSAASAERDRAVRQNLERIFGFGMAVPSAQPAGEWDLEQGPAPRSEAEMTPDERRLQEDLRSAGLI